MVAVTIAVSSRRSEAWWVVPLVSAPSRSDLVARVCGGTVGTMNVGSRATTCLILLLRYARGDSLPYKTSTPDQDTNQIDFQSGYHIPNTPLFPGTAF
jgi:hypothetical protein